MRWLLAVAPVLLLLLRVAALWAASATIRVRPGGCMAALTVAAWKFRSKPDKGQDHPRCLTTLHDDISAKT